MNTKNNRRTKDTEMRVETAFLQLLFRKHISKITVRELCAAAGITRTSFYAHYEDIYDLRQKTMHKVTMQLRPLLQQDESTGEVLPTKENFLLIFRHISENKTFYKYYFQNIDAKITDILEQIPDRPPRSGGLERMSSRRRYHIAFFLGGFNFLIKQWLEYDCAESPEEMMIILEMEYQFKPNF